MEIKGRNLLDGLPKNVEITAAEVREALDDSLHMIIDAIKVHWKIHLRNLQGTL